MKYINNKWAVVVVLLFTWVACSQPVKIMNRQALLQYINNPANGLTQQQVVNGIQVKVSYQPQSMLVMQELKAQEKKDSNDIASLEKKYGGQYYFLLRYSKDGKEAIRQLGSFSRYSDMVQVFSFEMARFVNLTTNRRDTLPLGDYLFEQTYGMSDANSMLLSFDKQKIKDSKTLDINIGECGLGIGSMKFSFVREQLDKTPSLNYNSSD